MCRRATSRLLRLTNNILDLSDIDAGHFRLDQVDFDLRSVVERTIEGMGQGKKPQLEVAWPVGMARIVSGDPVRFRQILSIIFDHAVRCATSDQILLKIEAAQPASNHLRFELSHIEAQSGNRSPDLQICRSLLEQMGGTLQTDSGDGGCRILTFEIAFSASSRDGNKVDHESSELEGVAPLKVEYDVAETDLVRILIAEDSVDSRFLLREFLKKGPYVITFTENGKEAVEAARANQFDLILMDIQMPVMDGLTATRLIREMEQEQGLPETPLLALTANTRKSDIELSLAAGCNAHVLKPISKLELLNTVQKYAPIRVARPAPSMAEVNIPTGLEDAAKRYILSKKNDIPRLMRLLENKQFDQLRILAHDMKGTGTSYGFPNLTWLGGQMECSATEKNSAELSNQMLQLFRYARETAEMMTTV